MRLPAFIYILGLTCVLAKDPDRDCPQIQRFVGEYTKFLKQMAMTTYPVNNFCSNHTTATHYIEAVEWFHYSQGNESCSDNFNHNRLNVIQTLYDQMSSIWEAAHCADCVSNINDTTKFMELYDSQHGCVKGNPDPCNACSDSYSEMQHYYEDLVQVRKGVVCFDIEDRMNQTRYAWSAVYNCCKGKQHSQKAFIWFASGISSLPVIFYLAMYFITRRKEVRERIAAPALNDQATTEESAAEEQPQTSASCSNGIAHVADENEPCAGEGDTPKLNNLNNVQALREGKLIDLHDGASGNLLTDQNVKLPPVKVDEDDVSLLGARDLL